MPSLTVGWVYNLEEEPSSTDAGQVIALAVCLSVLSCLSVVNRFIQRARTTKVFGFDDYAAAGSALLGVAYSIVAIYQTRWGLGLKTPDFPPANAVGFSRIQYAGGPIYCLAIMGFKLAILASYLRLAGHNRMYRITVQVVVALVVINQIIYTCLLSFACIPIRKQWQPDVEGKCINQLASYFGLGGSSLGFDVLIIILPFPVLRNLQLDLKKKIALGAMFGLGFFVTAVQGIRTQTIANLTNYTDSQAIIIWSIIEINVGVFVACVPNFAPLLRSFGRSIASGYRNTTSGNKYGGPSSGSALNTQTKHGLATRASAIDAQDNKSRTHRMVKPGTLTTVQDVEDRQSDDEVALWAPRHGWATEISGWQEGGSHQLEEMSPKGGRATTPAQHIPERGDRSTTSSNDQPNDIRVVHEISILRNE